MNDPLRKYRRSFRAWRNQQRLKKELTYYQSRFESLNLTIPDTETIGYILKKRYPSLRPKPKGTLNILAIYHHYNWENECLKPSLETLGTVRHYDWCGRFDHQARDWHSHHKRSMNEYLVNQVKTWIREDGTDVIFTYLSGEIVTPDTMKKMRSFGVPMVNLALNDKESFIGKIRRDRAMGMRDICRYFDICWTSTEDAVIKYCVEGALPVYLPEGANPDIHKPYETEKFIDVSFVGQCYGNRPQIIQLLKERGIHVEVFGYGWPNGALSAEEMVRMYSKSKINLGFSGVAGHHDTYCLKGRDFEVTMSGGLYLTEHNRELERFYDVGYEIVTYRGFDDLVEKIRDLLSDPEKAEMIRKKGAQRAHHEHTWEMRFEKIFSLIGLI